MEQRMRNRHIARRSYIAAGQLARSAIRRGKADAIRGSTRSLGRLYLCLPGLAPLRPNIPSRTRLRNARYRAVMFVPPDLTSAVVRAALVAIIRRKLRRRRSVFRLQRRKIVGSYESYREAVNREIAGSNPRTMKKTHTAPTSAAR